MIIKLRSLHMQAGYFSTPYLELISTLAKATVAGKLYYEKALSFSVQQEVSSFSCIACDDSNAVDVVRYRLELSVSDQTDEAVSHQTDEAVFVTFDTEILNRQTFELLKLHILWSAH
ncbi:hypothetical protein IGI04_001945 [Brassica rapa subsp. trilocularis]|uniref:Uncharacterized protein n=1 Tax=Brassica rapa subsp. trilocularis TaxID=1813537 RepID=A0ABQ7NU45_BRACM|nr:hypothetical protein IGI04_001945 [Brassica rapa subsp. trilocularis]